MQHSKKTKTFFVSSVLESNAPADFPAFSSFHPFPHSSLRVPLSFWKLRPFFHGGTLYVLASDLHSLALRSSATSPFALADAGLRGCFCAGIASSLHQAYNYCGT